MFDLFPRKWHHQICTCMHNKVGASCNQDLLTILEQLRSSYFISFLMGSSCPFFFSKLCFILLFVILSFFVWFWFLSWHFQFPVYKLMSLNTPFIIVCRNAEENDLLLKYIQIEASITLLGSNSKYWQVKSLRA